MSFVWRAEHQLSLSLLLGAALIAAPPPAHAQQDRALLERFRPILRYDSAEQYFAQPVSLPPESARVRPGVRVYGHLARDADDTWLQYWFFYAYNPQDRGIFKTGRHEGDWELAQFRLGTDGMPDLATLAQHSWAEGCDWRKIERAASGAPVLYVANGSHATYASAGNHDRPFPDPTDEADGEGEAVRPRMTPIDDQDPGWVDYQGRWGATEAGIVPGESSSPLGPQFQEREAWEDPSTFHERFARECGSGAPGRPWQLPAMVGGLGALLGLVLALRRRSRHRG